MALLLTKLTKTRTNRSIHLKRSRIANCNEKIKRHRLGGMKLMTLPNQMKKKRLVVCCMILYFDDTRLINRIMKDKCKRSHYGDSATNRESRCEYYRNTEWLSTRILEGMFGSVKLAKVGVVDGTVVDEANESIQLKWTRIAIRNGEISWHRFQRISAGNICTKVRARMHVMICRFTIETTHSEAHEWR